MTAKDRTMDRLFQPATLGRLSLKNAVVMAPLTRQRADERGVPLRHVVDYYRQRAGAGLIITEGTQPSFAGQGYCRTPGIHTPDQIAAWSDVAAAVHSEGSRIFMQIMHVGRIAHPLNRQIADAPVAPSAIKPAGEIWTDQKQMQPHPTPRALETSELPTLVKEFVDAARSAISAGMDGVEIHAANGYLLNQFLASNANHRTDGYGTTVEGRIRLVAEVVHAVGEAIGFERTGIRISPGHMFNDLIDERPIETHAALLDALPTARMAYVHLMRPDSFAAELNNAGDPLAALKTLRAHVKGPMIAAGHYTRETAEEALASGFLQAVVFGRPFIANPDFPERMRRGLPLAEAKQELFYTPGPEGYSDYPSANAA
jgi:N-ethylmaleimide reductase